MLTNHAPGFVAHVLGDLAIVFAIAGVGFWLVSWVLS